MSSYVYNTSLSYPDYLQAKSFVNELSDGQRQVQLEVSRQTCQIVASSEDLAERGYKLVRRMGSDISDMRDDLSAVRDDVSGMREDIQEGFDVLAYSLGEVTGELKELNARFHWGFSEVITQLGRTNDSLKELVAIAKTPAQTWAYNQFEIGREAMRKKLWPEALEAINRAIDGHGDNTGYKLEFRFHYAKGTIHLGGVDNTDPAVFDLKKAEDAFRNASRYAKDDFPTEAARAFLSAGWCAYCQGKIKEARELTEAAKSLSTDLIGETSYQAAKFAMHANDVESGLANLRKAMEADPQYGIRASGDGDFQRHEKRFRECLEEYRAYLGALAGPMMRDAEIAITNLDIWSAGSRGGDNATWTMEGSARSIWIQARKFYAHNAILGFIRAQPLARQVASIIKAFVESEEKGLLNQIAGINDSSVQAAAPRRSQEIKYRFHEIPPFKFHESSAVQARREKLLELATASREVQTFAKNWHEKNGAIDKHNSEVTRVVPYLFSTLVIVMILVGFCIGDSYRLRDNQLAVFTFSIGFGIPAVLMIVFYNLVFSRKLPPD